MVLTYRTGAGDQLASYYHESAATAELAEQLASYLGPAYALTASAGSAALPILDMHPLVAALLKIDVTRALEREEVANLLAGKCTDGSAIPGRQAHASTKDRAALTFTDFTFSAPKSLSIAIELGDEQERVALETAFMRANNALMKHIESEIGGARMGRGGRHGVVPGRMAVVQFHHYTARPTKRVADGADTRLIRDPASLRPGDMQRHIHNLFPHVTITDQGEVRAPDLQALSGRIHEWGAVGHAFLVTELRSIGVRAEIDPRTGLSHLPDVPQYMVDLHSARTRQAEILARARAGVDFDGLDPAEKRRRMHSAAAAGREHKEGQSAREFWRESAADAGYQHQSVVHPENRQDLAAADVRRDVAYEAALPMLEKELERRSTLDWSTIRTMAARGMIASGADRADDIEDVVTALFDRGVRQDGQAVDLLPGRERGQRFMSATTSLHVEQEREAIGTLAAAAADTTGSLSRQQIEAAIARVAEKKGYDFTSPHGRNQRDMAVALSTRGRAAAGIGAAGSGKGVVLEPVIDAHRTDGWSSYGVTVAWRQTHGLKDAGVGRKRQVVPDTRLLVSAGIDPDRAMALAPFLTAIERGRIKLDRKTLVVLDEVGTVSTQQIRDLARAQAKHGFKIIGTGDDHQCAAVSAGNTIQLLRHALGAEQIPELLETVRQKRDEDKVTAKLLRDGKATEAMQRKDTAGLLVLVPGDYDDAIRAGVDWLLKRQTENAGCPGYSVGVSVPSNADVLAFGNEYRARQRASGKLRGEDWTIEAQDQRGEAYDLAVALGDQVRLFNRVNASLAGGKHGNFGDNGTVAEVVGIDQQYGLRLQRADGTVGAIRWTSLQDRDTGRVRLAYGSATTIDARQSETLTDHATLLPTGSQAIDGKKAYSGDTRGKFDNVIITSHGAEKEEVRNRRPLGDPWLAAATPEELHGAVVENIGRNLSRQPEKLLGVDFLERAITGNIGGVASEQAAWFQARPAQAPPAAAATVQTMRNMIAASPIKLLTGPEQVRQQKRSMRDAAQRPKQPPQRQPKQRERGDVVAELADALRREGFKLRGAPVLDGQWHREQVEGDKGRTMSGRYKAYADGLPAGFIQNFKRGEGVKWVSERPAEAMTEDQRRALAEARAARDRQDAEALEAATAKAQGRWNAGRAPVRSHPYLTAKGIEAGPEMRRDQRGNLMTALRDEAGVVRNVQTITPTGEKRFVAGAQVTGLFSLVGEIRPDRPILIAEGVATAGTMHEATGLPVAIAYNAGNLSAVSKVLAEIAPTSRQIFAADNDHHLPRKDVPMPNVGREKAEAAAAKVGGVVLLPSFGEIETKLLASGEKVPTDWNDFAALFGKDKLKSTIETALQKEGIEMPRKTQQQAAERAQLTQAERDAARQTRQRQAETAGKAGPSQQAAARDRQAQSEQGRDRDLTR
jgi:phage/plasmid primase-like uncharacterized protein